MFVYSILRLEGIMLFVHLGDHVAAKLDQMELLWKEIYDKLFPRGSFEEITYQLTDLWNVLGRVLELTTVRYSFC